MIEMLTGAFILAVGLAAGYAAALFMPPRVFMPRFKVYAPRGMVDKYDKYRNPDGLLSRKTVKEKRVI